MLLAGYPGKAVINMCFTTSQYYMYKEEGTIDDIIYNPDSDFNEK